MQSSDELPKPSAPFSSFPPQPSLLCPQNLPAARWPRASSCRAWGRQAGSPVPTQRGHCCATEKKLLVVTGQRRLLVPGTACSHLAAPGAPWHSPQQILLVQLHPLSCLFDVSLALVPAPASVPTAGSLRQTAAVPPQLSWPSATQGWDVEVLPVLCLTHGTTGTKYPTFVNPHTPQTKLPRPLF